MDSRVLLLADNLLDHRGSGRVTYLGKLTAVAQPSDARR